MKKIAYSIVFAMLSVIAFAQSDFSQDITPSFNNPSLKLDCKIGADRLDLNYDFVDLLAISSDCTVFDNDTKKFSPMKGNISSVYLIRDAASPDSAATVFASVEKNQMDASLGDGGGVFFFKIRRNPANGAWRVVNNGKYGVKNIYFQNVSFKAVGGTVANSTFAYAGNESNKTSKLLVIENGVDIKSNKDLVGFSDTSNFTYPAAYTRATKINSVIPRNTVVKRYQAMGWPVEIDGTNGTVLSKVHRFGRGVTAIVFVPKVGYIIAYGGNPSVLARYTPYQDIDRSKNLDYPDGPENPGGDGIVLLQAYKQNADGTGDFTIPIALKIDSVEGLVPNPITGAMEPGMIPKYSQTFDSLMVAKEVALRAGATMFANIGDLVATSDEEGNPTVLISEKGIDDSGTLYNDPANIYKGKLAKHLSELDAKDGADGQFEDPYGRVLALNISGDLSNISVVTEGGASKSGGYFFSNPDKMEAIVTDPNTGVNVITIKENIPSTSKGRNPTEVPYSERVNEAYYLQFTNSFGPLPKDYSDPNMPIATIPFSEYKLYATGSNGSNLSSSGGYSSPRSGTFITNSKIGPKSIYDTYLTVVNGIAGTDKSYILAVRNIFPDPSPCLPTGLVGNSDYRSNSFQVWPNPTQGMITTSKVSTYTLADLQGRELRTYSNTNSLDLSDLDKGLYLLKEATGAVTKISLE